MRPEPLSREHRALIEDLVECHRLLRREIDSQGDRLVKPRGAGSWTAAEHILHVALFLEWIAHALEENPVQCGSSAFPSWRLTWILLSYRVPADLDSPAELTPSVILGRDDLVARVDAARDALLPRLTRADLEKTINLPHFSDVGLSQALRYAVVHARHHLRILDS